MANAQKSSRLVEQTISKLLDFETVPRPKDSGLLQLPHTIVSSGQNCGSKPAGVCFEVPDWDVQRQGQNRFLEKQHTKAVLRKVLIVIAWILWGMNLLAVAGNLYYGRGHRAEIIEKTIGGFIQVIMLAAGLCTLILISWLYYYKKKCCRTAKIPGIIATILLGSLVFLVIETGSEISKEVKLNRALSHYLLPVVTPYNMVVSGILYNQDKPSALVDYQLVHEGDIINGVRIVKIHRDKVEFERNGRRWLQTVETALSNNWQ